MRRLGRRESGRKRDSRYGREDPERADGKAWFVLAFGGDCELFSGVFLYYDYWSLTAGKGKNIYSNGIG